MKSKIPQTFEFDRIVRLTRSQEMALTDILVAYARTEEPQVFINCSVDPPTEVTVGDLLLLIGGEHRDYACKVVETGGAK